MPFDGRGRIKGTKKCKDYHFWEAFDWTIEVDSFYTLERCTECGLERKQYKRIATEEEKKQFLNLERGKGFWIQKQH